MNFDFFCRFIEKNRGQRIEKYSNDLITSTDTQNPVWSEYQTLGISSFQMVDASFLIFPVIWRTATLSRLT